MNQMNKQPEYWQMYQAGDKAAATPLLQEMTPTIDAAIQRFAGGDQAYKTQARILALNAAKTFDPKAGTKLSSHVYNHLQRLQRISAQRGNLTRVPENAALQRATVERARKAWTIDHGEEPTVEELADTTGISRKRIDDLANYRNIAPDSLFTSPEGDSFVKASSTRALDMYDRYIYDELDRTDKKIYEWSTGFGGAPRLNREDMARKLNISPVAVSKRATKITNKFNQDRKMIQQAFYGE